MAERRPYSSKGPKVSDDLQRLLRYIVQEFTSLEEAKDIERETQPSIIAGTDIAESQRRARREEEQRADAMIKPFREGLRRAYAARQAGGNAISLDDRKPNENEIADAMIHYLVGHGMATSTTRETDPLHYIYTVSVNWRRLNAVARQARVDLDSAINHLS